jgi:hypothetical protein
MINVAKHLLLLYRESPYAVSILAMESASLVQIANSIIRWNRSCMAMLHHQLATPQLLDICWYMYHRIQIPSNHPLVKEALRERRPRPSSVPFLTWVAICNNIWELKLYRSFASPSSFTYRSLLQHVLHPDRKKFLPVRDDHCPMRMGQTLFKHMYNLPTHLWRFDSVRVMCLDSYSRSYRGALQWTKHVWN